MILYISNEYFLIIYKEKFSIICHKKRDQSNGKFIDYYKYYNQIGDDEIIFPKVDKNIIEFNLNFTVNFFVVRKLGCGKSTLISLLLNEKRAKESTGKNTTNKLIKFIKKKYIFSILSYSWLYFWW